MSKLQLACIVILTSVFSAPNLEAQIVSILMRDGYQVNKVQIVHCSDTELFSRKEVFEFKYIFSITFRMDDEEKAKPHVEKFLSAGITVFIGTRKIDPTGGIPTGETPVGVTPPGQGHQPIAKVMDGRSASTPYTSLGIGVGLDFGGFGGRLSYVPEGRHVDLFFAGGYALAGFGVNGGVIYNILAHKKDTPTIGLMYGYNGAIYISGNSNSPFNRLYYGPSVSVGYKIYTRATNGNCLHMEIIVPFRPAQFQTDINSLKNNGYTNVNEPSSVLASIGYNFGTGRIR